jgi:hypothetical protein
MHRILLTVTQDCAQELIPQVLLSYAQMLLASTILLSSSLRSPLIFLL